MKSTSIEETRVEVAKFMDKNFKHMRHSVVLWGELPSIAIQVDAENVEKLKKKLRKYNLHATFPTVEINVFAKDWLDDLKTQLQVVHAGDREPGMCLLC